MNRCGLEQVIVQLIVASKNSTCSKLSYKLSNFDCLSIASASDATPCITQPLHDITIIEGRPLKLSCGIIGVQVTVNWFHNGEVNLFLYFSLQYNKLKFNFFFS